MKLFFKKEKIPENKISTFDSYEKNTCDKIPSQPGRIPATFIGFRPLLLSSESYTVQHKIQAILA
jgi:hypothetical protein